ncbi:TPA: hypothetical protein IAA87_05770 [Candidatus Avigastranaerophilus faecigallinarum]|nr:hypothetical protein [Candidatus Avigastranaerophilus faecigallinarum]
MKETLEILIDKDLEDLLEAQKKANELLNEEKRPNLLIDEVANAFFAYRRVKEGFFLEHKFGGYTIGEIYLFVIDLINKHIKYSDNPNNSDVIPDWLRRK